MALDFFRNRLDAMVDMRHPLAVLSSRIPWDAIDRDLTPLFAHTARPVVSEAADLLGMFTKHAGGRVSNAGRPCKQMRLMVSLLMLKNSFNLSDEEVVARFSENVVWQFFAGYEYYDPSIPCDPTQIGRFRAALGEAGLEELLRHTIETAVESEVVSLKEFDKVIVDTTVQEKAVAHPTDSRLLEIARCWLGKLIREIERKASPSAKMQVVLERATRLQTQQPHDKNKLYAFHAPEVECIGKGKARKPYEFGVKVSLAVTHKSGLMVGARSFPTNPYDGHILSAQMEQTNILLQHKNVKPKIAVVDLGFRGTEVKETNPDIEIIHRGKFKSLTNLQRKWLKRRQAIEPAIGHLKADYGMGRCHLKGEMGDALHAISCAIGYNIGWLLRAIVRLGLLGLFALRHIWRELVQITDQLTNPQPLLILLGLIRVENEFCR